MDIIGIDPGKSGGIAHLSPHDVHVCMYTSDNLICTLNGIIEKNSRFVVYLEKVHAMPNQGVTSMFTFGMCYGEIIGILKSFRSRICYVTPQSWKKKLNVTADKKTSIKKALELYPEVSLLPTSRSRVPSDGMAEALLIAHYGLISEHILLQ